MSMSRDLIMKCVLLDHRRRHLLVIRCPRFLFALAVLLNVVRSDDISKYVTRRLSLPEPELIRFLIFRKSFLKVHCPPRGLLWM